MIRCRAGNGFVTGAQDWHVSKIAAVSKTESWTNLEFGLGLLHSSLLSAPEASSGPVPRMLVKEWPGWMKEASVKHFEQ